jgi:hypothetical protein
VHASARARILETLADDALVLDVGGWAVPFPRADWMLDLGGYETRGTWGYDGDPGEERFSADTWVQRDICDREPWPFDDGQFAFAICSHTLEDVRDPVWVCQELARVARAGYVEVPSRAEEQSWGIQGEWVGWGHHHWLVDVDQDAQRIDFLFKHHVVHAAGNHLPRSAWEALGDRERIQQLWWEGSVDARERIPDGIEALDSDLQAVVAAHGGPPRRRRRRRARA